MSDRGPDGLEASEAFLEYMADLRRRWPADPELADEHGVAAGNGHFYNTDMSEVNAEETELYDTINTDMGRRAFCVTTAAAVATAAGAGVASADDDEPYFGTDYVQSPWIEKDYTIAEHESGFSSPLNYIDDNGERASLEDYAARVAEGESGEPNNPITLRADRIAADEYVEFPRDVYEDDDEEDELNWNDADHWETDGLDVETSSAPNGEDGLEISGEGTATFDDVDLDSGIARRYLQLVVNVDELPSDAEVYVRVLDSTGELVEAWIDADADDDQDGTIATEEESGIVYQKQLGEFDVELEDIDEIELEIEGADVEVEIVGMNLDRQSRWEFGTREYENDDGVETETIREPSGEFSIYDMADPDAGDLLPSPFSDADVRDLEVEIEVHAEDVDSDYLDHMWEDAGRYSEDYRLHTLVGFELPTAYDLDDGDARLRDEVLYPGGRYLAAEFKTDADEFPEFDDVDDLDFTDRSSDYGDASVEDSITLTSDVSADELLVLHFDVLLTENDREGATTAPAGAGAGPTASSGGFLSSFWGIVLSGLGGVGAYLMWARRTASDAVGA